jgi:hypothetical protein
MRLTSDEVKVLRDSLISQLKWLEHSFSEVQKVGLKEDYSIKEYDSFENLLSRYARTVDFLVRKVFRSIDEFELENQGTLIDTVNRAHKRGLFENVEDVRSLKDLRNDIAHEYMDDELQQFFDELLTWTPKLIEITNATLKYIEQQVNNN